MKRAEMTADQIHREMQLLRTDPHRYLALMNARIRDNPTDAGGYFDRHFAWVELGQPERALQDLTTAIELDPTDKIFFFGRGDVLRAVGRYENAIEDFNRAFALDTDDWFGSIGWLTRADCYAGLGNEAAALADAALLPDDHWLPAFNGFPGGNREQATAELKRRAAEAKAKRSQEQ